MTLANVQQAGLALATVPPQHRWIWGATAVGGLWYATQKYDVKIDKSFLVGAGAGAAVLALLFILLRAGVAHGSPGVSGFPERIP